MNNIASVQNLDGAYAAAESSAREAIPLLQEVVGSRHLYTGTAYAELAHALMGQEDYVESERMFEKAIAIFRERGAMEMRITSRQWQYATVLTKLAKYEQAERALQSVLSVYHKQFPDGDRPPLRIWSSLVALYDAWGKPEKAAEYRALLEEMEEAGEAEKSSSKLVCPLLPGRYIPSNNKDRE